MVGHNILEESSPVSPDIMRRDGNASPLVYLVCALVFWFLAPFIAQCLK